MLEIRNKTFLVALSSSSTLLDKGIGIQAFLHGSIARIFI